MDPLPGVLKVSGRMVTDPRISLIAADDEITISVENNDDATFWFNLTMSSERLIDFLGRIAVMHPRNSTALCAMLENVAIAFKM